MSLRNFLERSFNFQIQSRVWVQRKDFEFFKYSSHTQSVTLSVLARVRYTFRKVTLCKTKGSCVTSHM